MPTIKGPFDVKIAPQPVSDVAQPARLSRMSIDKTFSGALTGTSRGEMLAVRSPDMKSGGYVALERVTGTLDGKAGSFALQHSSTMDAGAQHQSISVVPGSGTEALAGLRGNMVVEIADGKHNYVFDYDLT